MKPGDLVHKCAGYGYDQGWTGIVLQLIEKNGVPKVRVITYDGIEDWCIRVVELIDEDRRRGKAQI